MGHHGGHVLFVCLHMQMRSCDLVTSPKVKGRRLTAPPGGKKVELSDRSAPCDSGATFSPSGLNYYNYSRSVSNNLLLVPRSHLSLFRQSFHFAGSSLWNTLPVNITKCDDIYKFKTDLKQYIMSQHN